MLFKQAGGLSQLAGFRVYEWNSLFRINKTVMSLCTTYKNKGNA